MMLCPVHDISDGFSHIKVLPILLFTNGFCLVACLGFGLGFGWVFFSQKLSKKTI